LRAVARACAEHERRGRETLLWIEHVRQANAGRPEAGNLVLGTPAGSDSRRLLEPGNHRQGALLAAQEKVQVKGRRR